ncbi:MAG: metallophosphoesterase [Campylobacterales bacterium]
MANEGGIPELAKGAVLVADAHLNSSRPEFLRLLRRIASDEIVATQLWLMGDNFDLLIGGFEQLRHFYAEAIELINRLAKKIPVLIFEGNHDFLLHEFFPHALVVARAKQPLLTHCEGVAVALAHGDRDIGWGYELYTHTLRSPRFLKLADYLTLNRYGSGFLMGWLPRLDRKKICRHFERFEAVAMSHLRATPEAQILIEGHFHQNRTYEYQGRRYIGLPSLACGGLYGRVVVREGVLDVDIRRL